jgi:hypothetical protein
MQAGGLGVLNLRYFGIALRCRWPWLRWAAEPRPWTLVPAEDDREALQLFKAANSVQLGDGRRAKFWTLVVDLWRTLCPFYSPSSRNPPSRWQRL